MPAEVTQSDTTQDQQPPNQATTGAEGAPPQPPQQATTEGQPPADGDATKGENAAPKTPLEVAKRVMAKEQKQGSAAKPQESASAADTSAAKPGDKPKAVEDEDDAALPFKDDPRWKGMRERARKLASENRILNVAKEKNESAIGELSPKAKAHDDLIGWFGTVNLTQQDVAEGFKIMAAVRNDPRGAFKMVEQVYNNLKAIVGETVPQDIQARVDAGEITEAAGREMAKLRADSALADGGRRAAEERAAREREEREQGDQERQTEGIVSALNSWGDAWFKRDPDAAKKHPHFEKMLNAEWKTNPPRTVEEARAQADKVLAEVDAMVGSFRPAPQPKGNDNLPRGGPPVNHAPVPKTVLDAARAGLARLHGG
jgi:hypothetical protein